MGRLMGEPFVCQWHVASVISTWTPDRRTLVDVCLNCDAFGLPSVHESKSQAATTRWVKDHQRWHRDTPPPGKIVHAIRFPFGDEWPQDWAYA